MFDIPKKFKNINKIAFLISKIIRFSMKFNKIIRQTRSKRNKSPFKK